MKCTFKVSIVGVGKVGATAAYAMCLDGTVTDLVLLAHHKETAEAEKLDLEHALSFLQHVEITATDNYETISGSELIVITAGAAQEPGQSRLDLLKENLKLFTEMIPKIYAASPDSIVLIVTNPVDILTYHSSQLAPFKSGQLFGSGTMLDTARFRFYLSEMFGVNPRSIHAYVLGEHGDHSFPVLSSAHISGLLLSQFPRYSEEKIADAFTKTQQAAYKIINAKGATFYAIATVVMKLAKAIYSDAKSILPVSIPLKDVYGVSGMALSIPCVIGHQGVEQAIPVPLSVEETKQFTQAADALKEAYQKSNESS
jgi:L-lactate dehydrogenase